jgi:phosphatidylinositol alpha-1,6-mannosyltransferase
MSRVALIAGVPVIYVGRMSDGSANNGSPRPRTPRLLLITPDFPPAPGGIQLLSYHLASGMKGFETKVVALDGQGAGSFDAGSGVRTRRVRVGRRSGAGRILALNAAALSEALRFRPDVTLSAHIVGAPAAATVRQVLGARTVQYFHANEIAGKPRLSAFAARRADVVIAVSAYTASLIRATGVSSPDIRLIPPGVELASDRTPLPAERPTILTIARLNDSYKGHDVLLRALAQVRARVPAVEWIVIGDGPLRGSLERLAGSLGVAGCVRFLGSVSDVQRNDWLRRADVFAMPSRLPGGGLAGEGFGIVYLEAAAYGKPVVAGNVAGALDAVLEGETGLLVDPTDPIAVSEAITRLLLDAELARGMGRAGAQRARDFAWPVIATRVEAVLLEAAA